MLKVMPVWFGKLPPSMLGDLETKVMEIVWKQHPVNVNDVSQRLAPERDLAYTTVMTTLDRLYKKGLLKRTKVSHAFAYEPAMTREEFERKAVSALLGPLFKQSQTAVLSGMIDLAAQGEDALELLAQMVEERRAKD